MAYITSYLTIILSRSSLSYLGYIGTFVSSEYFCWSSLCFKLTYFIFYFDPKHVKSSSTIDLLFVKNSSETYLGCFYNYLRKDPTITLVSAPFFWSSIYTLTLEPTLILLSWSIFISNIALSEDSRYLCAAFGNLLTYIWLPNNAEETSKLLPILFCAARLLMWLRAFTSLRSRQSAARHSMEITDVTTHAELPSPVFDEAAT